MVINLVLFWFMPLLAAFLAQPTTAIVRLGHVARHHHSPQDKTQQWPALHLIEKQFLHITLNRIFPLSYATVPHCIRSVLLLILKKEEHLCPEQREQPPFSWSSHRFASSGNIRNLNSVLCSREINFSATSVSSSLTAFLYSIDHLFVFAMATWKPWCDKVRLRIRSEEFETAMASIIL